MRAQDLIEGLSKFEPYREVVAAFFDQVRGVTVIEDVIGLFDDAGPILVLETFAEDAVRNEGEKTKMFDQLKAHHLRLYGEWNGVRTHVTDECRHNPYVDGTTNCEIWCQLCRRARFGT